MTNIAVPEQEPLPQDTSRSDAACADFSSRYWTFLFDNLKRSIEQIQQTCESDRDTLQCQEVLHYLRRYCRTFEDLLSECRYSSRLSNGTNENSSFCSCMPWVTASSETGLADFYLFPPLEHSQSVQNGADDLSRRQKRLHNSDINLNANNAFALDTHRFKRQKSSKYRRFAESSSLLSLPSLFSPAALTNDSSATLTPSTNQLFLPTKRSFTDEAAVDADDEKDARDESVHVNRHHRYHHQLSHTRLKQQDVTSEDDDEELLLRNHRGMIDFMDRQIFDAFDQEESLTAALEAEQERTIASLMAEQEDLEQQLKNVSEDDLLLAGDDGSELEESELSTTKTSTYFMSLQDDRDEKGASPLDVSRDANDFEPDGGKPRGKALRTQKKFSSPSRIRPINETLREAAERQARAFKRRQILRDAKTRKMRELTRRVNEVRQWKEELIKARKATIEMKMHRAEEKRQYLLLLRAKKAGDEDLKGQEIAFIKLLQQENRRQTLKERYQKEEQFKQFLEEERVKKHDEHKQRELAAENRRKELEAIRQTRLNEMQEKWKTKERMIEQHLNEKRKQKQSAAIAKQKNFQQKRADRVAYLKTNTVELKKKMAQKQEESSRRHVTQIEEIRRKAVEMASMRGPSAEDQHHVSPTDAQNEAARDNAAGEEPIATRKCCTLCNLLLASDLHLQTHLRGTRHNQLLIERLNQKNGGGIRKPPTLDETDAFNSECIAVVTNDDIVRQEMAYNKERKHTMKKRAKKLRLRMVQRSTAYEAENAQRPHLTSTHKPRIQRFLNELEKSLSTTARKEPLNTTNYLACQRILTEFAKIFDTHGYEKDSPLEQRVFFSLNGYATLSKMIELRAEGHKPPLAPESLIALTVAVYRAATNSNVENALYILNSGKILTLVESLVRHLTGLKIDDLTAANSDQSESEKLAQIDLVGNLAEVLASLMVMYNSMVHDLRKHEDETNDDKLMISRLTDFISYMANVGVLDRIASFFRSARAIVNTTKSRLPETITHLLNLVQQMIHFSRLKSCASPFGQPTKTSTNDPAQVLSIMKTTNFCEIFALLYGILIHETDNSNQTGNESHPAIVLPERTALIVQNSLVLLNTIAVLDLDTFQTVLGEDTISLQLRHVANYLLAHCIHQQTTSHDALLNQIILLIGYYCVLNQENQCRLAFGNRPTVLQQLSCTPFRYFVEPKYMDILFPTLIACSFDCDSTRAILQTEMSLDLIVSFLQTKLADVRATSDDDGAFAFHLRFPREEWSDALKYYRPASKSTTDQVSAHDALILKQQQQHDDEEKENVSHSLEEKKIES